MNEITAYILLIVFGVIGVLLLLTFLVSGLTLPAAVLMSVSWFVVAYSAGEIQNAPPPSDGGTEVEVVADDNTG